MLPGDLECYVEWQMPSTNLPWYLSRSAFMYYLLYYPCVPLNVDWIYESMATFSAFHPVVSWLHFWESALWKHPAMYLYPVYIISLESHSMKSSMFHLKWWFLVITPLNRIVTYHDMPSNCDQRAPKEPDNIKITITVTSSKIIQFNIITFHDIWWYLVTFHDIWLYLVTKPC